MALLCQLYVVKRETAWHYFSSINLTRVERRWVSWINSEKRTPFGENLAFHLLIPFVSSVSLLHIIRIHKEVFYFQIWHIHPCICQRDLIKHLSYPLKRVCGPIYMENTPAWASSSDTLEQQTILSFPSGLNKVTLEVLFLLKETVLQLLNARDFGSRKWPILFSQWTISSQREGNSSSLLFFFQQNYYLQSERGLL